MNRKCLEAISVLLVDDEPKKLYELIRHLEDIGLIVLVATSTFEALQIMSKYEVDIIITDLLMPPPDGIDFLKDISIEQSEKIIIVYTSYPHNNFYRKQIKDLQIPIAIIQKTEDVKDLFLFIFKQLVSRWNVLQPANKNALAQSH